MSSAHLLIVSMTQHGGSRVDDTAALSATIMEASRSAHGRVRREVIRTTKRPPPSLLPSMSKRALPCADECFQKSKGMDDLRAGGVQQEGKSAPAAGCGSRATQFEGACPRK
jgi:hypothetical protein